MAEVACSNTFVSFILFYFFFPIDVTVNDDSSKQKRETTKTAFRPQKPDEKGQLCIVMKPVEHLTGIY